MLYNRYLILNLGLFLHSMMSQNIEQAVAILKAGGLVAFPTETVYGLGGDASNPEAIARIFKAKRRPTNHPLIVHIGHVDQLTEWADPISPEALLLAQAFWPGPITLILPKKPHVRAELTGGQAAIGIRIPKHPIALQLLQGFGKGLAAPSANQFTHVSPTTARAVQEELGTAVDLILDGGDCEVGLESTIVDLTDPKAPTILRPGMISEADLTDVLGRPLALRTSQKTQAPGMHLIHYAPQTPVYLLNRGEIESWVAKGDKVGLITYSFAIATVPHHQLSNDPAQYAQALYRTLRALDHLHLDCILIENVPQTEAWIAIQDRLNKASGRT
jgi:L-threonylcarbamoyladenylate synthase